MHLNNLVAVAACLSVTAAVSAQQHETLDHPVGEFRTFHRDSGPLDNAAAAATALFSEDVRIEGAAWIRVYFADTALAPGSFVRIRSRLDGEVQELDANAMAMWGNTSAYFNGDVGITDFLQLLGEWGMVGTPCDFDNGGVGITDFLALLGNWGACP